MRAQILFLLLRIFSTLDLGLLIAAALKVKIASLEASDANLQKLLEMRSIAAENRLSLARNANKPFAYDTENLVRKVLFEACV